jgi:hypothetical protein
MFEQASALLERAAQVAGLQEVRGSARASASPGSMRNAAPTGQAVTQA